jgi:hypothetical protein
MKCWKLAFNAQGFKINYMALYIYLFIYFYTYTECKSQTIYTHNTGMNHEYVRWKVFIQNKILYLIFIFINIYFKYTNSSMSKKCNLFFF